MASRPIFPVFVALQFVGCSQLPSQSPAGPHLRYVATRLDQGHVPLAFALKVTNHDDEPAIVDEVAVDFSGAQQMGEPNGTRRVS